MSKRKGGGDPRSTDFRSEIGARDAGLEMIAAYERAIVESRLAYLNGAHYPADYLAQERAAVVALAGRIADALRADYRARSPHP